jgi:hypothetical protein
MATMMNRIQAVKAFIEDDSREVDTSEFMAFWKSCDEQERAEFAGSSARQLGVILAG